MTEENRHRTKYAEDALRVENGTQPDEIQDFVERRAENPFEVNGVIVWDFNNHALNAEALREQSDDLLYDEYVIPYQASGVWGYMVTLLPERIREAEILTYRQREGEYAPFPNYIRHSDPEVNNGLRSDIRKSIDDQGI